MVNHIYGVLSPEGSIFVFFSNGLRYVHCIMLYEKPVRDQQKCWS